MTARPLPFPGDVVSTPSGVGRLLDLGDEGVAVVTFGKVRIEYPVRRIAACPTRRFTDDEVRAEATTIAALPVDERETAIAAWVFIENALPADAGHLTMMVRVVTAQPADPFAGLG